MTVTRLVTLLTIIMIDAYVLAMDIRLSLLTYLTLINQYLWGPPMLAGIALTGAHLMYGLRFMPIKKIGYAFGLLLRSRHADRRRKGDIAPFNALMTALSGAVGTGNIVGVATAIYLGGPGALLYMWLIALIGMAIGFTEATSAVNYRKQDSHRHSIGGPMFYIQAGMAKSAPLIGRFLSAVYAFLTSISVLSIGNMVQVNSIAAILSDDFGFQPILIGLVVMVLVGAVILGGIKRIADFAGMLVPLMIIIYLVSGLMILVFHYDRLIPALQLIVREAFSLESAKGGAVGAGMVAAIRYGVARGVFSNEAGLGTASIAHAAAKTNDPVRQGYIAMLSAFIDTIVVCSITGLVILVTQSHRSGATGAVLTGHAFSQVLPLGNIIVTVVLAVFAFTTMIGYSYYGEKCVQYLVGDWVLLPYRLLWLCVIPLGAVFKLELVWSMCETMMALMMIPNLIGLWFLGPEVFQMSRCYRHSVKNSVD